MSGGKEALTCTDAELEKLRWEAELCGHSRWADYATLALGGDARARGSCAELLRVAAELGEAAPVTSVAAAVAESGVVAVAVESGPGLVSTRDRAAAAKAARDRVASERAARQTGLF